MSSDESRETHTHRPIRSFVRRQGRMTPSQQHALDEHWQQYGLDHDKPIELQTVFPESRPLIVDIGFGMGEALIAQAQQQPQHNFIGIDVHRPGVGRCLAQAHEQGLSNLKVMEHDAQEVLRDLRPQHSLAAIQVFFPDPWPKKRHHKRRLIQTPFLDRVTTALQADGILHIATDWQPYAEHIQELLQADPRFQTLENNPYLPARFNSRFQQRGLKLGHEEYDLIYQIA